MSYRIFVAGESPKRLLEERINDLVRTRNFQNGWRLSLRRKAEFLHSTRTGPL